MSVLLTKIPCPLSPEISIKIDQEYVPGKKLDHYVNGQLPADSAGITWVVSKNGLIVTSAYCHVAVQDGDKIAICPRQEGAVAAAVAGYIASAIAGATVSSMAAAAAVGIGTAMAYGAAYLATMFVMGYGMSMLAGAIMGSGSETGASDYETNTTYGWGILEQTSNEGVYIPRYYGTNKVAGHTINKFVKIAEIDDTEALYMLNALCDHELDSITDILINENPAEYYKECSTYTRLGTLNDELIEGFDELVTQNDIGSKITQETPVIYETKGQCQKIDLILSAPSGLYYTNSDGGLDIRTATYTIKYRVTGESAWTTFVENQAWAGETTSGIKRLVSINDLALNLYDVYLIRTNDPETSYRGRSDIYLASVQEILKEELTYPGLAKYAIKVLATDQLAGSVPATTCLATLDTVQVFNNSTWVAKSSKNPAWICYDLLVQHKIPVSRILYDEFLEWAEFCDTNVAASGEPEEKRIEINIVVQGGNVWEQVQKIANMGRAVIIRRNTKYGVFIDRQDDTVSHLFTMGNIVENTFSMQYLPKKDRATAVEIEYTDPDRDYTRQIVTVFSDTYIEDTSTQQQKATVSFEASFSQAQAVRDGVYRINSNRYLVRVVTFDAFIDSFACVVGDIFEFQHESVNYLASDIGGVIKDAGNGAGGTNPYVTLDKPVQLESGYVYKIKVRLSDDTLVEKTIDTDSISDFSEPFQTLPVTLVWTSLPGSDDIYAFGRASTYLKKYRITSVTKKDELTRTIIGLEYIEEIYTDNDGFVIEEQVWENRKQEATQVKADEFLVYSADGGYISNVNVTWHRAYSLVSNTWAIWMEDQTAGTAARKMGTSSDCQYTITSGLIIGHTYKIYITLDSQGLIETDYNTTTITILGKLAPPDDVATFSGVYNTLTRSVNFTWGAVSDLDLSYYEIRQGDAWETGTKVAISVDNAASIFILEPTVATITYWIKAVDTSGIGSENASSCEVAINTNSSTDVSVPDSLSLTSTISTNSNGVSVANLVAAWGANAEALDSFSHYKILLLDVDANQSAEWVTTENQYTWTASVATQYGAAVCSVDKDGNDSAWCEMVYHTTDGDDVPPGAPTFDTELNIVPGFKVMGLTWNKNTEYDLSHYVVQRSTSSSFSSNVVEIGVFEVTFFTDTLDPAFNLDGEGNYESSITYYYRLAAVDTSGNQSEWSAVVSGESLQTGTADIAYNAIFANHIFADQINSVHINSEEIFVGMTIQSNNYIQGATGWKIDQNGNIELNGGSLTISDSIGSLFDVSSAVALLNWTDGAVLDNYTSSDPLTITFESDSAGTYNVYAYLERALSAQSLDRDKIHILINGTEITYDS